MAVGAILFLLHELFLAGEKTRRTLGAVGNLMSSFLPTVMAILTFIGGSILTISGTIPALPERMKWIKIMIPFPVMEASHFLGSLSGVLLMVLALGILNRTRLSYYATLAVYVSGILFSLLKGLDYEEAAVLAVFFLLLIPCRKYFYRKSRITSDVLSPAWFLLVAIMLISGFWIGMFSYKHVEYTHELFWQFGFSSDASRFLRATLGSAVFLFVISLLVSLRKGGGGPAAVTEAERVIVRQLRTQWGGCEASLSLLPDKRFLFANTDERREGTTPEGFIMYGVSGKTWVSMGDPVGSDTAVRELIVKFRTAAHADDAHALFYQISERNLPLYIEFGYTIYKIGEAAVLNLIPFSLAGGERSSFRNTINRLTREGFAFEVLNAEKTVEALGDLRRVSDEWLKNKNVREKGFSLGYFDEIYLSHFRTAVIRDSSGRIMAFSNLWESEVFKEISIDLMLYSDSAPPSVMDFLFLKIMMWAKESGFERFNLGMAPFSGIPDVTLAPLWNRFGAALFHHGENFYNFQGLRHYKEKFDPEWKSRYLAVQGGFGLPRNLVDLAILIGRGKLKSGEVLEPLAANGIEEC